MFKNEFIEFIPIVNIYGTLINILTKHQLHALLLQDIKTNLSFDFSVLDERIVDHEIFQRPWGFYKTTVMNDYFQSKIISVNLCLSSGLRDSIQALRAFSKCLEDKVRLVK